MSFSERQAESPVMNHCNPRTTLPAYTFSKAVFPDAPKQPRANSNIRNNDLTHQAHRPQSPNLPSHGQRPFLTFPTPSEQLNQASSSASAHRTIHDRTSSPESSANQQKPKPARRRASRTDNNSDTPLQKKKLYITSLEEYILYLHSKVRLAGAEPIPMERVATSKMSSISTKMMMIYMQKKVTELLAQRSSTTQQRSHLLNTLQMRHGTEARSSNAPSEESNLDNTSIEGPPMDYLHE